MDIVQAKYRQLAPQASYLKDPVILAQAWKKTHTAIRRHNWYADVLELDCSTIDLERQLAEWALALEDKAFKPEPMMLVPAPKNGRWEFPEDQQPKPSNIEDILTATIDDLPGQDGDARFDAWQVKQDEKGERSQKLRPLAHLTIRDQTLASAIMLCLADAIESAQGDTSERDPLKAQQQGVFSYGNRLHCSWDWTSRPQHRATFSWGNSRTYSQYFQDYRTFLARPRKICAELSPRLPTGKELFVVALDLKSFFDCIDRKALISQLQGLHEEYVHAFGLPDQFQADAEFWCLVERIFAWEWRAEDNEHAQVMLGEGQTLPTGLPQGLIASGFFANAYMVGLDRLLGKAIGTGIGGAVIRDYCRYVDDIRLVVEADCSTDTQELAAQVQNFAEGHLRTHQDAIGATSELLFNDKKTTVTPYRSISKQNNLSALMDLLQEAISGTFDLDSLTQAAGGLDGLLWMSEQLEDPHARKPSPLTLANIAVAATDVRDDTVKRFVATRMATSLRMRLAMTDTEGQADSDETVNEDGNAGAAINHEFEATARKLIKCWADNPALVLLLRVGLDLYPHPKLLGPVLDALQCKLFSRHEDGLVARQEVLVAEYVAADLLRAGAVETGYRDAEEYPDVADIEAYRRDLAAFARRILQERKGSLSWYLRQQVLLFLATVGDHSAGIHYQARPDAYTKLHQALLYVACKETEFEETLPLALVGQQFSPNSGRFAAWLVECLRATKSPDIVQRTVLSVSLNRPDLIQAALKTRSGRASGWRNHVPSPLRSLRSLKAKAMEPSNRTDFPLALVISGSSNAFSQENAVLLLAKALLESDGIESMLADGLRIDEIQVWCEDWKRVQSLPDDPNFLKIKPARGQDRHPLYETPPWVEPDSAWMYGLGRILRACVTGEFDYTTKRYLATEDASRYTGLRSTWFKRRFGLLNSGNGLLDEPAPISPWLSNLLSILLRWPGTELRGDRIAKFLNAKTRADLLNLVLERIAEQRSLFGRQSGIPIYVLPTQEDHNLKPRAMRIAVVQPMLPRRNQFNDKEPCRWSKKLMAQHRRHLTEVCRLTYQKLRTWSTAQDHSGEPPGKDDPLVDLILFPELSVHPEHLTHLRALSDKTGATLFVGLTFFESPKLSAPVNQALWMIRTETPGGGRTFQYAWQGKAHPIDIEKKMGVKGYRPHQVLVEFPIGSDSPTRVAGAICYDATDLCLLADLRDRSDIFLVAALNQDVETFDNMVSALRFHMYQPVILANMGEFGGSTAQVPLRKHEHLVSHIHGGNQVSVSVFEVDPSLYKVLSGAKLAKEVKTPPAGYKGRPV
jgi:hypothetical protein